MQHYADIYLLQSHFAVNKYVHTVASRWIFINILFINLFQLNYSLHVSNK